MITQRFLFLDTQTTGMRPPKGALLEIAWTIATGEQEDPFIHSHLVALPEGHRLSPQIAEITGLKEPLNGDPAEDIALKLSANLTELGLNPVAIAHYAQFEKPFIENLLQEQAGSLRFLCTQKLAQRIFPELPSANIRAVAGFLGAPLMGPNRAAPFTLATHRIWRGLSEKLKEMGLHTIDSVFDFIENKERPKTKRYSYRLEQLKRLSLPEKPGVYRMLTKSGEILYVGKATSLKDRVNSYFRGIKGRDRKKLEMLAQVWNLQVTETRSPLEAALLETDEIKRHNPRYNLLLKEDRSVFFYDRDFTARQTACNSHFCQGPFRTHSWIETMRLLPTEGLPPSPKIFFLPIPQEILEEGWRLFQQQQQLSGGETLRQRLALSLKLFRKLGLPLPKCERTEEEGSEEIENVEIENLEEQLPTPEEIAAKFERLFRRCGHELTRVRRLTRLLNCEVEYQFRGQALRLFIQKSEIRQDENEFQAKKKAQSLAWEGLGLEAYDRMSILLSELSRHSHKIMRSQA